MGTAFLIAALLLTFTSVCGVEVRPLCLSCHTVHYEKRGKCTYCHLGNPVSTRKNIAHAGLRAGKYSRFSLGEAVEIKKYERMLEQFACRRCHVSNGRGNRLAANLDSASKQKKAEELADSIRHPVVNMPNFGLNEEKATILVNAVISGSNLQEPETGKPITLHFNALKNKNAGVFTRSCGSCHRLLSERYGALGTGNIGPNLTGLLSINYPKTFKAGDAWTFQKLKAWMNNPREFRPWAQMMPVTLNDNELKELLSVLQVISEDE